MVYAQVLLDTYPGVTGCSLVAHHDVTKSVVLTGNHGVQYQLTA